MRIRKYETMYVLRPDLEEEAIKQTVQKFSNLIAEQGGQVEKVDEWGKRKLAYPINHFREGYYVLMNFTAGPSVPQELERVYKITDEVIRYLIVREDE
ncbi:SSU ribosomal protein S6P [Caldicoprobacter faecalis]|uniref:Small ribosomal subunit protein bS6 n=1 Tax=Caldicoprobacter faecalis TaxID=937334 RepID=A0A1I5UTX2_9FIRM|nr:30S ribosomal protein S6 [Caldicoprobacter algeriensis]SFP98711.1 SSU ribosomal protein S6P [Caldicoprobacter faecalis]